MSKTHKLRGDTVKHDKENFTLMKERVPCVEVKNSKAALFVKRVESVAACSLKISSVLL